MGMVGRIGRSLGAVRQAGIVNLLNFGLLMDTWNLGWTPGSISAAALRRLPWPCR
jgi:hypothetical protein